MYTENDWRTFLSHHGIKGQKWGVRNGPPYPLDTPSNRVRKYSKTKSSVDDIISSLSNVEKERLGLSKEDGWEYLSLEQGEHILYRALKQVENVPVSFFDLLDDGDIINLALATRSGDRYRGKGYGSKAADQAIRYLNNHPEIRNGRDVIWGVRIDNSASIAIAKKYGFELDETSENDGWVNYVLSDKKRKEG